MWSGFHLKTIKERQTLLSLVYPSISLPESLKLSSANKMTENCFSTLSLPLSLSLHLNLNSNLVLVPISTEEPSIVAALSFAFKTISNFNAISSDNLIIAQVQLFTSVDPTRVVNHHKLDLILRANLSCKSMVDRGGGVIDVYTRFFPSTINGLVPDELSNRIRNSKNHCIVHFVINVCDAMGANVASTVAGLLD